ncbi:hypothetical protein [Enterococcus faecium]|uniref:hypothetical protein n=1 Tax=Enterococcus faecium TaxID=1352 RepID=UPI000CF05E0B|nr:hypothetical protein [Enterococcus faecium]PQC26051.1 hypothetical protein CUM96_00445 [Enterococcus faecium]PQD91065.1 hypothetical protein CUM70_03625 [Enterococcus faecium]
MSDGVLGLIGMGISLIGTIGITIYNQRSVKKQNEENEGTQRMVRASQKDFEVQMLAREQEFQEKLTQKQIDANLKAKARIEWISEVRRLVSEYLVVIHKVGELLFLLKENNIKKKQEIRRNQSTLGKDSREILESNKQYAIETDLNEKELKKLLSELENQKYKALAISEQLVLYFSNQKEYEKIRKSLNNIKGIIIDIYNKAYGPDISETYYDEKSPILNENSEELSEEIGKYLKIEWDRAKKGE